MTKWRIQYKWITFYKHESHFTPKQIEAIKIVLSQLLKKVASVVWNWVTHRVMSQMDNIVVTNVHRPMLIAAGTEDFYQVTSLPLNMLDYFSQGEKVDFVNRFEYLVYNKAIHLPCRHE